MARGAHKQASGISSLQPPILAPTQAVSERTQNDNVSHMLPSPCHSLLALCRRELQNGENYALCLVSSPKTIIKTLSSCKACERSLSASKERTSKISQVRIVSDKICLNTSLLFTIFHRSPEERRPPRSLSFIAYAIAVAVAVAIGQKIQIYSCNWSDAHLSVCCAVAVRTQLSESTILTSLACFRSLIHAKTQLMHSFRGPPALSASKIASISFG